MAHEFTDINSDFKKKSFENLKDYENVKIDRICVIKRLKLKTLQYKLLLNLKWN